MAWLSSNSSSIFPLAESWHPAAQLALVLILVLLLSCVTVLQLWRPSLINMQQLVNSKRRYAGAAGDSEAELELEEEEEEEKKMKKLPPGPLRWPVVGCLPAVGFKHRHRTFYELSKKYGPVMQVPIGAAKLIIVHGAAIAQELLKTQDAQFCSRPLSMTGLYLGFDHCDVNLTPFNPNWQATRKALSLHLLSPSKIASQSAMRRHHICSSVASLLHQASMEPGTVINVSRFADNVITNIIIGMLFGKRYSLDGNDSQGRPTCHNRNLAALAIAKLLQEFDADLREGIFLWGELNLADFFPVLERWDLQGLKRRFSALREKLEKLFELIIQEHRESPRTEESEGDDDFINVLLSQKQLSDKQLMGIMSNSLIAGIDTTAKAIEWAMAELVTNQEAIIKAQQELDQVVGKERLVNEMDIEELPYLQAISKEVLRLHPSAPMDDPHLNEKPSSLGGFYIPANSIVLHNLWALGQDNSIWDNPTRFYPDRFLKDHELKSMNLYGSNFQLLPFSSGRRRCPAYQFATLTLQHVVGVLLHAFDWSVPLEGTINMEESDGIVVGLKHPLMLSITSRLPFLNPT